MELQSLIATCEYDAQLDFILRVQIVIGVADNKTREKLLFDPQLTLDKAVDILRVSTLGIWEPSEFLLGSVVSSPYNLFASCWLMHDTE